MWYKRIAVALMVGISVWGAHPAAATNTDPNEDHKVTLCHRTGSATNPYVIITTDIASDGYVKAGHNEHEQVGNGLGGDIIPAYEAFAKDGKEYVAFSYPGKNLDTVIGGSTGADILANGCVVPVDESPSPTVTPSPSDSPTPTETPVPTRTPKTHTPTWTPTWTPTNGQTPGEHRLAETGLNGRGIVYGLAGLGLFGTGMAALYAARKKSA